MIKKLPIYLMTFITASLFLSTIVIIIIGTIAIKNNKLIKIFGYTYSIVATESMVPVIERGDIIIIKDYNYENIGVGDIVVYKSDIYQIHIVHRVIEIKENGNLITKGDNNNSQDQEEVSQEKYQGVVVKNFQLLNFGDFILNGRNIIFLLIILIFGIILVTEIINIIKGFNKNNEEKLKVEYEKEKQNEYEKIKEQIKQEILEEYNKTDKTN